MTTLNLNKPGELIAALPGVLGFVPERSLAVVAMKDKLLHCVVRVDTADVLADQEYLGELASRVAEVAESVFVVWVSEDADLFCVACDAERTKATETLTGLLAGVAVRATYCTDMVTWRDLDGDASGRVDEVSPLTCAAVVDGRLIQRRRSDMVALVAATEPMSEEAAQEFYVAAGILGAGLLDGKARDRLYALAVAENAAEVEASLIMAARVLPGEFRAHALATMAFFAYCRGDGPLAGVALDAARAIEDTSMAVMLDTALRSGMAPEAIRKLATAGKKS